MFFPNNSVLVVSVHKLLDLLFVSRSPCVVFCDEGVAAYVGWQSSSILKPLLQQGLSDTEEFVIYKSLNALTCMCQLGLLQKPHIYEFVGDIGETTLCCFQYLHNEKNAVHIEICVFSKILKNF